MRKLFLIIACLGIFTKLAAEMTTPAKNQEKQPVVFIVRDNVRKSIPMSKTKEINPDSIQSIDVFRDTIIIKMKPHIKRRSATVNSSR